MMSLTRHRDDHELIEGVLFALDGILGAERGGKSVPRTLLAGATEFFTSFVERCHQVEEEQELFPLLASRGILDGTALQTMRDEHEEGGRLLRLVRPLCARRGAESEVGRLLEAYVALERRHVAFENAVLLPRAEAALSATDDARLQQEFERIETRLLGPGGRGALFALAGALTEACRALSAGQARGARAVAARDLLRPPQEAIAPGDSLSRAAELMRVLEIRELAVVEQEALVGILTRTDVERHRGHLEWTTVRTAMTSELVTVAPEAPIRTVAQVLLARGYNCVPVAVGDRLVGVLRRADLLRFLAEGHETPTANRSH